MVTIDDAVLRPRLKSARRCRLLTQASRDGGCGYAVGWVARPTTPCAVCQPTVLLPRSGGDVRPRNIRCVRRSTCLSLWHCVSLCVVSPEVGSVSCFSVEYVITIQLATIVEDVAAHVSESALSSPRSHLILTILYPLRCAPSPRISRLPPHLSFSCCRWATPSSAGPCHVACPSDTPSTSYAAAAAAASSVDAEA